jgi:hypothetical protein
MLFAIAQMLLQVQTPSNSNTNAAADDAVSKSDYKAPTKKLEVILFHFLPSPKCING